MAVSITWKSPPAGAGITSLDHGSGAAGATLSATEIGISHDGANSITNCRFYIAEKASGYTGGASAAADLAELLEWGDASVAADFGGFQINMDQIGGYAAGNWPAYDDKNPAYGFVFRTNIGDTSANGVLLSKQMSGSMLVNGVIPTEVEASFQCRVQVPANEGTVGVRQFDHKLSFTYTS